MNLHCAYPIIKETIPKSKLGYATNNIYEGFPPLMSDGRATIASHQQDAVINNGIQNHYNIKTNWEYRKFLQKNADVIMHDTFQEASNDCGYFQRYTEQPISTFQHPVLTESYLEPAATYNSSDLKQIYLSREQLNASIMSPEVYVADTTK